MKHKAKQNSIWKKILIFSQCRQKSCILSKTNVFIVNVTQLIVLLYIYCSTDTIAIIVGVGIILGVVVICGGVVLGIIKVLYNKRRHKLDINQSMLYMYIVCTIYHYTVCICVTYDRILLCSVIVGTIVILTLSWGAPKCLLL